MKRANSGAFARTAVRVGAATLAATLVLATGPACLWLGAPVSNTPSVAGADESPRGHHVHHAHADHGVSHEMASNAQEAKFKHHCQCLVHRGIAPSGSGVSLFVVSVSVEPSAPPPGFSIHFAQAVPPSSLEPAIEPPVPIALV